MDQNISRNGLRIYGIIGNDDNFKLLIFGGRFDNISRPRPERISNMSENTLVFVADEINAGSAIDLIYMNRNDIINLIRNRLLAINHIFSEENIQQLYDHFVPQYSTRNPVDLSHVPFERANRAMILLQPMVTSRNSRSGDEGMSIDIVGTQQNNSNNILGKNR